jgi:DNA mismatch repair protein MutS
VAFSILFPTEEAPTLQRNVPDCFPDLHLDSIVETITRSRTDYRLEPYFYTALHDPEAIRYRQDVMRDLDRPDVLRDVTAFADAMRTMRTYLAQSEQRSYPYEKAAWFLDAVLSYGRAVLDLAHRLNGAGIRSAGLSRFREYLSQYTESASFSALVTEAQGIKAALADVRYSLLIQGSRITVRPYADEPDYSAQVEETFTKFKRESSKDYRVKFSETTFMNHVEAQILDLVARLHPTVFTRLRAFHSAQAGYMDDTIALFDREIQFYLAYRDFMALFQPAALSFCYPVVSDTEKIVRCHGAFDLALATQLVADKRPVVLNDIEFQDPEQVLVITGPNQGGKTTFARMVGQMHFLASLGLPIPGDDARIMLCDRIFTHFEREESLDNLRGKLEDDLSRVHTILAQATSRSLIILNEIFTSTTWEDEVFLSQQIMQHVLRLGAMTVWVTFIDELASYNEKTVSLVSVVEPGDPPRRTFKIVRAPANGLSYALSLAKQHRVTYAELKERISS